MREDNRLKTIVFANGKGGVGKSTLAALLVEYLSDQEIAVDLTDADPNQTTQTWLHYCREEGRRLTGESPQVTVVDTSGTSGAALNWIRKADLVVCPIKGNFADLDLVATWFDSLHPKIQQKFVFIPNMLGRANEQKRGVEDLQELVSQAGCGVVLDDCGLKNRDAIYPDLLKGSATNFFRQGARWRAAKKEAARLCSRLVDLMEVEVQA